MNKTILEDLRRIERDISNLSYKQHPSDREEPVEWVFLRSAAIQILQALQSLDYLRLYLAQNQEMQETAVPLEEGDSLQVSQPQTKRNA